MSDDYLMRFVDGPLSTRHNIENVAGESGTFVISSKVFGWPLPDRLGALANPLAPQVAFWDADDPTEAELPVEITESPRAVVYKKVSQSEIPPEKAARMSHVVIGAQYEMETP